MTRCKLQQSSYIEYSSDSLQAAAEALSDTSLDLRRGVVRSARRLVRGRELGSTVSPYLVFFFFFIFIFILFFVCVFFLLFSSMECIIGISRGMS
eukprot:COSAG05_NODE_1346_length_5126_cov_12.771434_3_plen_95_part_00